MYMIDSRNNALVDMNEKNIKKIMPQPGIEPGTPAWQTRALPTELLRLADQKHDLCLVMWPQKEKMHPYA